MGRIVGDLPHRRAASSAKGPGEQETAEAVAIGDVEQQLYP
jgi:hypothetical protein